MPLRIRIRNLNKRRRIGHKDIRKTAICILRSFKRKDTLIDITFLNNGRIKALNKKYMGRSAPTDVLSFALEEDSITPRGRIIGDIYISSDMAYSNARRFKTSFRKELSLYTIHGLLHLLGFGDKTAREKARIRRLEAKFLRQVS